MKTVKFAIAAMITSLAFVSCANQPTGQLKLTPDNIEEIIDSMTLDEKIHIVSGSATWGNIDAERVEAERKAVPTSAGIIISIPRLGIPSVVLADGPAGLRIASPCTGFPIGSMLASTWDREVVDKVGTAIGNEVLEYGVDVILGPGANLHRNPLCGRNFEYYSEDPYLAGKIAASYINGVQSNGVGTSIKHFAVNSQEYNRLNNDAIVSQKALRELYLKQFEIAVKEAQPWTVMTSYNYINGVYAPENYDLITGALRGDFGFQGMVMTDWGAGKGGYDKMLKAGNDLIEPAAYTDTLSQAIQNGTVTMEELDAAVRNILKLVVKTPSFKGYERSYKPDLEAHAKISREAATNGMVLLENRGEALPLKKGSTVALFGSGSYSIVCGGTGSGDVNKPYTVSIDEGMKSAGFVLESNSENAYREHIAIEKERIDPINANADWFVIPLRPGEMQTKNLESIISASVDNADAAIITIARNAGEGQDRWIDGEFNLQDCEMEMITKVCEAFHNAGKKVTVILNIGGVVETASWKELPDAVLLAWQPGQEGGNAIADVICGDVNPSGHLPMTFPASYADVPSQNFPIFKVTTEYVSNIRGWLPKPYEVPNVDYTEYSEDVEVGYRYYTKHNVSVSYPFGYGLSYTTFQANKLKVKAVSGGYKFSFDVKNTGDCAGKTVLQFYSQDPGSVLTRELRGFAKTPLLEPGKSCKLSVFIPTEDLAYFDESRSAWITAAGTHQISLAFDANTDIETVDVTVEEEMVREVKPIVK